MKAYLSENVFQATMDRLCGLYRDGHRVIVSFSAGKDSGVCVEMAILAATKEGRLPVDVVMRDEEIMVPGTFEYAERIAARDEVRFHWLIAHQPIVNAFNRASPYYWVFDPELDPEDWVRTPPDFAQSIGQMDIQSLISVERFPPAEGKYLISLIGLRTEESPIRRMAIRSSKGWLTKPDRAGCRRFHPIYDWNVEDVWKAIADHGWDYNQAYDVFTKFGVNARSQRIAPPFMNVSAVGKLDVIRRAFPVWFNRVSKRLPGIRSAAMYGRRACIPLRRQGELWSACYQRTCIDEAPAPWIAERAAWVRDYTLARHQRHSSEPFPENANCPTCPYVKSWKKMGERMFNGDPFSFIGISSLKYMEPEFFREGAGTWGGGKPAFQ